MGRAWNNNWINTAAWRSRESLPNPDCSLSLLPAMLGERKGLSKQRRASRAHRDKKGGVASHMNLVPAPCFGSVCTESLSKIHAQFLLNKCMCNTVYVQRIVLGTEDTAKDNTKKLPSLGQVSFEKGELSTACILVRSFIPQKPDTAFPPVRYF